ncbi:MAG: hypothetical protein NTZ19_12480 [Bacteroidetes bacterium]|nr:hypothetical protein [Bacteroidota bacterium]
MKYLKLIIALIFFAACSNVKQKEVNKMVRGVILSESTGKPIPNARVILLCWQKVRSDEEDYNKIDTVADANGEFKVLIPNSYKLNIGSIAAKYYPAKKEIQNTDSVGSITLSLEENKSKEPSRDLGRMNAFNREYSSTLSINKENYGINLLAGNSTTKQDSIDIGVELVPNGTYPKVLIAYNKAGIIPITSSTINVAPENGYLSKYELQGNEKGFFIKCRNGTSYARLMLISKYDTSVPYKGSFYKDYGLMFGITMQPNGKEIGVPDNFRLDHFALGSL